MFSCDGNFSISVVAFDTGTICGDTRAYIERAIYVQPIAVEILTVTPSSADPESLEISWKMENASYYEKELHLFRRKSGEETWQFLAAIDPIKRSFTDTDVNIYASSYEYKIETNIDCDNKIVSQIHKSILLESSTDENNTFIEWNEYEGWIHGVKNYEIWISIDSSEYKLLETAPQPNKIYEYMNNGFRFLLLYKSK